MFDRRKYKNFALKQLKGRWGVPVIMTLIVAVIMFIFNIPNYISLFSNPDFLDLLYFEGSLTEFLYAYNQISNSSTSFLVTLIQTVASAILAFATINVYLKMSRSPEKVTLGHFIEGMNFWGKAALASLWKYLWVFLWSLLFVIPGIIKSIAYSQMYFILCEYENVSVTKAMRISIVITQGHKVDLFITYLSFLGWALLSALTLGIGTLWLEPYMNMTLINAYHGLMREALETGKIKPEDLTK